MRDQRATKEACVLYTITTMAHPTNQPTPVHRALTVIVASRQARLAKLNKERRKWVVTLARHSSDKLASGRQQAPVPGRGVN